jgi:large subunit ribosomal protein L24
MKIRKNDSVLVIGGNNRGKTGKVLKVFPDAEKVIIEGVNMIKRHTRPNQQYPQGAIVRKEAPIHVSKVMIICAKCNTPTRVGYKILDDGTKTRSCKNCGEMIL